MIRRSIAATILALGLTAFPAAAGAQTANPTLNGVPCRSTGCTGPEDAVDCWIPQREGWQPAAAGTIPLIQGQDWRASRVRQRAWDGRWEVLVPTDAVHCPEVLPGTGVRVSLEDVPEVTAYLVAMANAAKADAGPETLDAYDWARLAECESGGDPRTDTGNGYYGLYQFSLRSWQFVGGRGLPSDASAVEQTERARRLLDIQGPAAWPACSRLIGWS